LAAGLEAIQASQAAYLLLVDLGPPAERAGEAQIDVDGSICLASTVLPGEHDIKSIQEHHYFVKCYHN